MFWLSLFYLFFYFYFVEKALNICQKFDMNYLFLDRASKYFTKEQKVIEKDFLLEKCEGFIFVKVKGKNALS